MDQSHQIMKSHTLLAKIFHWGFIVIFIYALIKQLDDVEQLEDFSLLQFEMVFASIFLIILVIRYVYMHSTQASVLPENTPNILKLMASSIHLTMYVSLSMIALSGLMIGTLYWLEIKNGLMMNVVIGLHEVSVTVSYISIVLHIFAAIYHRLKCDGIWTSMVPFWKEKANK